METVREGWAWHKRFSKAKKFATAEAEARKRGLWADPAPISPWEWRKRSSFQW
jgi:endonuclease YncB( thermonuclease family)